MSNQQLGVDQSRVLRLGDVKTKNLQCCPKGHTLEALNIGCVPGTCDGCHTRMAPDSWVMDCRKCNFYLCERCCPMGRTPRKGSFLSMTCMANVISQEDLDELSSVCTVSPFAACAAELGISDMGEVVVAGYEDPPAPSIWVINTDAGGAEQKMKGQEAASRSSRSAQGQEGLRGARRPARKAKVVDWIGLDEEEATPGMATNASITESAPPPSPCAVINGDLPMLLRPDARAPKQMAQGKEDSKAIRSTGGTWV